MGSKKEELIVLLQHLNDPAIQVVTTLVFSWQGKICLELDKNFKDKNHKSKDSGKICPWFCTKGTCDYIL